uniref:Aspartate dehydrogenase domain-containing protein n=2 Tax=Hirondellea gigas TaxID=1518452 RepID=A0A2P2I3S7_9CRUS
MPIPKRVGIVGYGHLGQFLEAAISKREDLEVAFIWNRSPGALSHLDQRLVCHDLTDFASFSPDLVVEVAHPDVSKQYGALFLKEADYLVGSPTALADAELEASLRTVAQSGTRGLYLPAGALWGSMDLRKMADLGTLQGLKITMKKHPSSFKLKSPLKELNDGVSGSAVTLYDGPVRGLCPLAPNNVNTMAAAAVAAHNLGFDGVNGCLISDPALTDRHIVLVEAEGKGGFRVCTERVNPAAVGAVTGNATYNSFLSSVVAAGAMGPGVHLC